MNEAAYLAIGVVLGAWIRGGMRGVRLPARKPKLYRVKRDSMVGIATSDSTPVDRDGGQHRVAFALPPSWDETDLRGGFVEGEPGAR